MKERVQGYMWSKGRASAPSGKGPKFGSKCDHRRKKVWHFFLLLSSGFFCSFFFYWLFCQLSLFLTITSLSRVSLTLALLAPNLEHALTMSPPPPLHAFTFTHPCLHTLFCPPTKLTFFLLCALFYRTRKLAQARDTLLRVRISLVIVWPGPPSRCLTTTLS